MPKMLYVTSRDEWRAWLVDHHAAETEVWLVYYKKHTSQPRIPYDDAVEEALCFGWIDSIVKRIDGEKFAQKFTPRQDCTRWSALNRRRVRKLIQEGRMTEAGLAKIDLTALDEEPQAKPRKDKLVIPGFVRLALMAKRRAWENFQSLAPSTSTDGGDDIARWNGRGGTPGDSGAGRTPASPSCAGP